MSKAYIGTSGFSYPHWGNGVFYPKDLPQKDWFGYYTKYFDTVELNVSFYRLPKRTVFEGWRKQAGQDFVFAVKGNRFITHIKKLENCQEPVKRFFEAVEGLRELHPSTQKDQLAPDVILWQLPPRFKVNPERLSEFLEILTHHPSVNSLHLEGVGSEWRHAFEFRDESWLTEEVYKILEKYKVAIVFQDNPGWPVTEKVTADFVYLRFHGKTSLYSSCYTENELKDWAKKIKAWKKKGLDCYAYFNNDALGYAIENAKTLKFLISDV